MHQASIITDVLINGDNGQSYLKGLYEIFLKKPHHSFPKTVSGIATLLINPKNEWGCVVRFLEERTHVLQQPLLVHWAELQSKTEPMDKNGAVSVKYRIVFKIMRNIY